MTGASQSLNVGGGYRLVVDELTRVPEVAAA